MSIEQKFVTHSVTTQFIYLILVQYLKNLIPSTFGHNLNYIVLIKPSNHYHLKNLTHLTGAQNLFKIGMNSVAQQIANIKNVTEINVNAYS